MNKKIAVFLSSHEGLPESYRQTAIELGKWLGQNKHTLVYGGARKGLMEVLAQSTHQYGGRIYGVVPQILIDNHLVSDAIDITFYCADLNDRKAIMVRESEIFLALPGGIGTLDEIFTVLAANTIGLQQKHVILFDVDGCWTTTMNMLQDLCDKHLVNATAMNWIHLVHSIEELNKTCQQL